MYVFVCVFLFVLLLFFGASFLRAVYCVARLCLFSCFCCMFSEGGNVVSSFVFCSCRLCLCDVACFCLFLFVELPDKNKQHQLRLFAFVVYLVYVLWGWLFFVFLGG